MRPTLTLPLRLLLAAIAGLLVWPAVLAGNWLGGRLPRLLLDYGPLCGGAVFGLLVLVPFIAPAARHRVLRGAALVLAGAVIYALAVRSAVDGYGLPIAGRAAVSISGVLGALLSAAAASAIAPLSPRPRLWPYCAVSGLLGGLVVAAALDAESDLVVAAAHAVWEVLVCLALVVGVRKQGVVS